MPPAPLIDPAAFDTSDVLVDREGIYRCNPQRFEMVQLTAIIHLDLENKLIIGYKQIEPDEFWVRGHMPELPLDAGRLDLRSGRAAFSYFSHQLRLHKEGFIAFGGMEDVRFRGQVRPGDRLLLVAKAVASIGGKRCLTARDSWGRTWSFTARSSECRSPRETMPRCLLDWSSSLSVAVSSGGARSVRMVRLASNEQSTTRRIFMLRVTCRCGEKLKVPPENPERMDCPKCGARIRLRRATAEEKDDAGDGYLRFLCPCGPG